MDWQTERETEVRQLIRLTASVMGEEHWRTLMWTLTAVSASASSDLLGWRRTVGIAIAVGLIRLARSRYEMHSTLRGLVRAGFNKEWLEVEADAATRDAAEGRCDV